MIKKYRWRDDYGEDPVTRESSEETPFGTVTVSHSAPVPSPWSVNLTDDSSNSPSSAPSLFINKNSATSEKPRLLSQESGFAPFETLYHEFNFEAIPVYNFWEQDEEKISVDRGNVPLEEMPRYIRLVWDEAPDLKDPAQFQKRSLSSFSPDSRDQFIQLSPFGFGAHSVVGANLEGRNFLPAHLQPSSFEQNVNQAANGFVSPGIVQSVVSVRPESISTPSFPSFSLVDEDEYLSSPSFWGIPYSEFNAALWRRKSSVFIAQQVINPDLISTTTSNEKHYLFDGQFAVCNSTQGNNFNLRAQNSSSPAISLNSMTATSEKDTAVPRVLQLLDSLSYEQKVGKVAHSVKTNFIDTNFAGAVSSERVNNVQEPHEAESIIALSTIAGNLVTYAAAGMQNINKDWSIPSFSAPSSLKPLEYIGYIIEKYEQQDGSFKLVDTIYIPGKEYTEFVDSKVKYGSNYRYRIRSALRWVRPRGIGVLGKDPTRLSPPGSDVASLTPNDASYFTSEWSTSWAYASLIDRTPPNPPDEIMVRPHSAGETNPDDPDHDGKPFIEIVMKLPGNPQQDINKMVIYRKLQDESGVDLTPWIQIKELSAEQRQGNRVTFITQFQHQQDDITGTKFDTQQIKRNETFVEFAPLNCRFRDFDVGFFGVDNSFRYVYAGACFTRHGERSSLSDQIAARLNVDWRKNGEFSVDFVSCSGVDKDFDVGIFGTYPERRWRSEVIFKPNLKTNKPGTIGLSGQSRVAQKMLSNSDYVMRIESLDNGEYFDVPVNIKVNNIQEEVTTKVVPETAIIAQDSAPPSQGKEDSSSSSITSFDTSRSNETSESNNRSRYWKYHGSHEENEDW